MITKSESPTAGGTAGRRSALHVLAAHLGDRALFGTADAVAGLDLHQDSMIRAQLVSDRAG
jgi:hypothetical protein